MKQTQSINLQEYTKLPLKIVVAGDKSLPDVCATTPTGVVQIKLKEEHYPFIFGSVTQIDRHTEEVLEQIINLEKEAKEFLLDEWLKKLEEH